MKDKRIVVLVESDEKSMIEGVAIERGFDNVSAYIRYLCREDIANFKAEVSGE